MKTSKSSLSASACAVNLLSYRPRARGELAAVLLAKGYPADETSQALDELVHLGYLNDISFMESWCYYRRHVSAKGRRLVRRELLEKGISRTDMAEHFDAFYSPDAERECLQQLLEKQLRRHPFSAADDAGRQKLAVKFIRKGFPAGLVFDVLGCLEGMGE